MSDTPETQNVFEASETLEQSSTENISVLQPEETVPEEVKHLTAEDFAKIAAAFDNLSKSYLQAFLYLEKCCQDGAQMALDMSEYLKNTFTPTTEGTDTDG